MKKILFLWLLVGSLLSASAQPTITSMRQKDTVGLYDKFEVGLGLKADYNNPFDPDQIDITATFTAPSGRQWLIHGFYYASFGGLWKVRFSPNETGAWKYAIHIKDKDGETTSDAKSFIATPSSLHGALVVAPDKRYLQYRDGTPFYGVGLWYNDGYSGFDAGRVKPEELDRLKSLGVNFFSSFITPLETQASGLGRYDQNICGRLDQLLELCEERDMELSLNLWFHAFLSQTVWGGGNERWETNPYQQITKPKDFYRSDTAWALQEKLYRYMIARWGYSRSLGIWFVIDEINGTEGWVSGDSAMACKWAAKVNDYFKTNDPYNRPTTGTRSGGKSEYFDQGYRSFDLAAREIYERQGWPVLNTSTLDSAKVPPLVLSYTNYASEISKMWAAYGKPVIIGETGWDHVFYEPSMPGYLSMYHDALWVALANGTPMTPFWWAYSDLLNDNVLTHQLTSIRRFTDSIPFSHLTGIAPAEVAAAHGNAYAMKSDQLIFGWVVNVVTDVAGDKVTLRSIPNGHYLLRIYHTWRGRFIKDQPVSCTNGTVQFELPRLFGLDSHANYIGPDAAFVLIPNAH